jgi:hypothetical protein
MRQPGSLQSTAKERAAGVGRLDEAIDFWERHFGLGVRNRREGPDAALARLWGITPDRISRQTLVATPSGGRRWAG